MDFKIPRFSFFECRNDVDIGHGGNLNCDAV